MNYEPMGLCDQFASANRLSRSFRCNRVRGAAKNATKRAIKRALRALPAMLRCRTTDGCDILFFTSHAVPTVIGPVLEYEFENAVVRYDANGDDQAGGRHFTAAFRDGTTRDYGNPDRTAWNKLWQSVACVRTGASPVCGIEACIPHTLCVNGAQDSASVREFPAEAIIRQPQPEEDTLTWVEGLQGIMQRCYAQWMLPSELGCVDWAQAGRTTSLDGYTAFPSSRAR